MVNFFEQLGIYSDLPAEELRKPLAERHRLWLDRSQDPALQIRLEAQLMLQLVEEAEQVLLDEGKRSAYIERLNSLSSEAEADDPRNILSDYRIRACRLHREKRYQELLALSESIKSRYPNYWLPRLYIGIAYENLGQFNLAIECIDMAIELDTRSSLLYEQAGYCYYRLQNYPEAIRLFNKALSLGGNQGFIKPLLADSLKMDARESDNKWPPGSEGKNSPGNAVWSLIKKLRRWSLPSATGMS